ncbi:hypothetical protein ABZR34_31210 [Pseudomonas paraeruginosa]|uniref:hypothetical protein n=1 Tax=Pseudomonas paraeruginosa TaxID=2994495 RepID=UPI00345A216C
MTLTPHDPAFSPEEDTFGLMFTLQADGSYATAEHSDLLTFEHGGSSIANPCRDESSTVTVDPHRYNFREVSGLEAALRLDLEDGEYLLLTGYDTPQFARLSRCDGTGQIMAYCFLADVP